MEVFPAVREPTVKTSLPVEALVLVAMVALRQIIEQAVHPDALVFPMKFLEPKSSGVSVVEVRHTIIEPAALQEALEGSVVEAPDLVAEQELLVEALP